MRRASLLLALVLTAGCSFTTATGFDECTTDLQCGASRVCLQHFCIALPEGCVRAEGRWDAENRIMLAALLPQSDALDGGVVDDSEVHGLDAMKLAVEEANARDGVDGQPFSLLACNTEQTRERLLQQLDFMVQQVQVPAVLTSWSSQTIAAANAESRKAAATMIMSATATSPELSGLYQQDSSVWRVAPPDTQQATVMEELFRVDAAYMNTTRVAIVYEDSAYGQGLAFALRPKLEALGKTVTTIPFAPPIDAALVANQLDAFHDGVTIRATVLVAFPDDVVPLITACKSRADLLASTGHKWMLSDSAKDPIIVNATTQSELVGMLGTAPAQGAGAAFPIFKDRFFARFGIDPSSYSFTSHSYDAMWLTMLAAAGAKQVGGITGANMAKAMTRVSAPGQMARQLISTEWQGASQALLSGADINVEGSSGPLDFDLNEGAPSAPYEVWQVTSNAGNPFVTQRLITP